MSRQSQWDAAKPIRGGVPICFPWFGPHATDKSAPGHGFARLLDWTLVEARDDERGATHLSFQLGPPAPPPAAWPHTFAATYHVIVGSSLSLALEVHNPGSDAFTFEEALHTYFAVQDVRTIEISGLAGTDYLDKVGGTSNRNQGPEPIRFTAETDRVYVNTQGSLHDSRPGRAPADRRAQERLQRDRRLEPVGRQGPGDAGLRRRRMAGDGVRRDGQRQRARGHAGSGRAPHDDGDDRRRPLRTRPRAIPARRLAARCPSFAATPFHADGEPP